MVSFSAVAHVTCVVLGVFVLLDSLFFVIAGSIENVHFELIGGRSISGSAAGALRHIVGVLLGICAWESRSGLGFVFGVYWSMLPASYFPRDNLGCSIGVRLLVTGGIGVSRTDRLASSSEGLSQQAVVNPSKSGHAPSHRKGCE